MFAFNKSYFLLALLLFITETLIALYVHDGFVRPYAGDFLVVMLLYCMVRSFITVPVLPAATGVLLLAYLIEASQYIHLDRRLGLEQSVLTHLIIGQAFSWADILAYTLGILLVISIEKTRYHKIKR